MPVVGDDGRMMTFRVGARMEGSLAGTGLQDVGILVGVNGKRFVSPIQALSMRKVFAG